MTRLGRRARDRTIVEERAAASKVAAGAKQVMVVKKSVVVFSVIVFLLLGSLLPWPQVPSTLPGQAQDGGTPQAEATSEYPAVDVVKRVGPAVVTVINQQTVTGFGAAPGGELVPAGAGTGFIINEEGHIVTNWHVVTGGEEFQVVFADGETREAELVGSDQISDLAVVKVDGDVPGTVGFGDSSLLQPGQPVLAIGSPLGAFTNTVTDGIVSGIGRNIATSEDPCAHPYTNLIQHDAPINVGNSGGPLLNLDGEVVGVNTLGIPEANNQPVQGLFFAIPSNTVKKITDQIIAEGGVTYPYVGVTTCPVTPDVAAQLGLSVDYGVYVIEVGPDTPAEDAGIEVDDIILELNGQRIDQETPFIEALFEYSPGDTVELKIQRGDDEETVSVTLGERPAPDAEG
jgi:2-alkenal reductase